MTFDQVLVFHKIVETGSFKGAAAALFKTQPAISFAIKKLEEEMEASLFDRSNYRPELTEHGKMFYERSMKLVHGMGELESLSKSFQKKEEPEISVTVDGISPLPKLLSLFKRFGDKHPNTRLNLSFDVLSESERKVVHKEALFGVTHFIQNEDVLEIVPITKIRMIPVMSRELYRTRNVKSQKDLADITQVVVADRNKHGANFGLLDQGKRWRLNDNNFKSDIILAGLGWGHLPEHQIEREVKDKKLVVLNFEDIHPRELPIYLIRLKKVPLGIVAQKLWDELTALHD